MTLAAKKKRLKELTKERTVQEKRLGKLRDGIAKLNEQLSKKNAQVNAFIQTMILTEDKLRDLSTEISAEIAEKNKEY